MITAAPYFLSRVVDLVGAMLVEGKLEFYSADERKLASIKIPEKSVTLGETSISVRGLPATAAMQTGDCVSVNVVASDGKLVAFGDVGLRGSGAFIELDQIKLLAGGNVNIHELLVNL